MRRGGTETTTKTLILAGGFGTRLGEETTLKPKPMVEIGGYPILWHIMKIYSCHGFTDFVILTGYKSHVIKDFFVNYYQRYSDLTVDLANNSVEIHTTRSEPWKVTLLYTGEATMTGGRIKRARDYVGNEPFMLTYGDGVSDVDINDLVRAHKASGRLCTMTAVQLAGRFGAMAIADDNRVSSFMEKPKGDESWVNGGFFVCQPEVFDYIPDGDGIMFEREPMEGLVRDGQLNAYRHTGFWQPMDMLRDKVELTRLWEEGRAPWAKWIKRT